MQNRSGSLVPLLPYSHFAPVEGFPQLTSNVDHIKVLDSMRENPLKLVKYLMGEGEIGGLDGTTCLDTR